MMQQELLSHEQLASNDEMTKKKHSSSCFYWK
jgi:hypothetical protein